jgi:tetratricopeptide (TPR) repeat protein
MRPYRVSYFGDIAQFQVRELAVSLADQEETGALLLRRERVLAKVFFEKGRIVYIASNRARDSLVRHLFEMEQLDLASFEAWRGQLNDGSTEYSFIEFFQKRAGLQNEQMQTILLDWLRMQMHDLVRWYRGSYVFLFDETLPRCSEGSHVEVDPRDAVLGSLSTGWPKEFLREHFRDRLEEAPIVHGQPAQLVERLGLTGFEAEIVLGLDGSHTVRQIVFGAPTTTERAFNVLLLLESLGYLELAKVRERRVKPDLKAPELGVEGMGMLQRLKDKGQALLALQPFKMLDIGRYFTEEDLRKGYYTIAQNFHQKEYVDLLPPELRELSYAIFDKASEVFEALVVWEKKRGADNFAAFRHMERDIFDTLEVEKVEGELCFLTGLTAYKQGALQAATDEFRTATKKYAFQSQYRSWLAWTNFQSAADEDNRRRYLGDLRKAADEDPTSAEAKRFFAEALERAGKIDEANEQYRHALKLSAGDPNLEAGYRRTFPFLSAEELEASVPEGAVDQLQERKLRETLVEMEKGTYFEVLSVAKDASVRDVRNRYFDLAKLYHPDGFRNSRQLEVAEDIFVLVNEAYDTLANDEKRADYLQSLRALKDQKIQLEHERRRKETRLLQKGKSFLQANKWDEAAAFFKRVLDEKQSENPLVKVHYAWALFNHEGGDDAALHRAARLLHEVEMSAPEIGETFSVWGKMHRKLNEFQKAKKQFDRALAINPDDIEALREVRLLNQRLGETPPSAHRAKVEEQAENKKGLFGSIFGRKK